MSENGVNQLPPSIQGDGRKFISLLKNYLKEISDGINDELSKVQKIFNTLADNPDTIKEQIKSVTVEERSVNGSVSLIVNWDSSDIKQYSGASIDVKVGDFHDSISYYEDKQVIRHYDTPKTNTFTIDNVEIGKKYWIRIRGRDIKNAKSEEHKAPIALYYVSEETYVPRPPYEATVVFDRRGVYWSWKQYPQNEYQWTELRLDTHVGELHNRLDLTTDWHSTARPYARIGTAYIYNKGVGNAYSAPVKLEYSKPVPRKPQHVHVTPVFTGLYITFDNIPEDCYGANVYINNEKHFVVDNKFSFNCSTGTYTIKVAYTDIFGDGDISDSVTVSTIEEIPVEMLNKEKLGIKAVEDGIIDINKARAEIERQITGLKNADSDSNAKINSLNAYRTEVDKKIGNIHTALTAMNGVIDAKVKDAKDTAEARLTITENAINSTIDNKISGVNSSITQLSNAVDVKVKDAKDTAESRLTATKNAIGTMVQDNVNNLRTSITQVANSIEIKVKAGVDKLTGQEIVSRINLAPDTVSISGKYIHITGQTVFDNGVIVAKHIGDKAIVGTKIADGAINTDKLVANAVTGDKIAANAVTADKIKAGSVTSNQIATNAVTADKIKSGSVTGDKVVAGAITGDKIAGNSISGDKIKAGSIDTNKIKAGAVDATKLDVSTLSAITARIGELKTSDSGARTVIKDNLIEVYDENNRLRVRLGVF
nr:MAG TPA: minor structural protein [Caudoviricetes sp.]